MAGTEARWDDAERHLERALEMNERIGARPWIAHTQRDYANVLLARDESGATERAQVLVSDAAATYRELGMKTHETNALALVAGVRSRPASPS